MSKNRLKLPTLSLVPEQEVEVEASPPWSLVDEVSLREQGMGKDASSHRGRSAAIHAGVGLITGDPIQMTYGAYKAHGDAEREYQDLRHFSQNNPGAPLPYRGWAGAKRGATKGLLSGAVSGGALGTLGAMTWAKHMDPNRGSPAPYAARLGFGSAIAGGIMGAAGGAIAGGLSSKLTRLDAVDAAFESGLSPNRGKMPGHNKSAHLSDQGIDKLALSEFSKGHALGSIGGLMAAGTAAHIGKRQSQAAYSQGIRRSLAGGIGIGALGAAGVGYGLSRRKKKEEGQNKKADWQGGVNSAAHLAGKIKERFGSAKQKVGRGVAGVKGGMAAAAAAKVTSKLGDKAGREGAALIHANKMNRFKAQAERAKHMSAGKGAAAGLLATGLVGGGVLSGVSSLTRRKNNQGREGGQEKQAALSDAEKNVRRNIVRGGTAAGGIGGALYGAQKGANAGKAQRAAEMGRAQLASKASNALAGKRGLAAGAVGGLALTGIAALHMKKRRDQENEGGR